MADQIAKLDKINPQRAAVLAESFRSIKKMTPALYEGAKKALTRLRETAKLSDTTHEIVDMCVDGVVSVVSSVYVMPDMWNSVFLEVIVVIAGIVVNDCVVAAAGYHQEVRLLAAVPLECACNAGSRADSSDIAEQVRSLHTDEERLSATH